MRVLGAALRSTSLLCLLAVGACYSPPGFRECSVRCAEGTKACPEDTSCGTDGWCHGPGTAQCDGPPVFAGLATVEGLDEGSVRLSWEAATDDQTASEAITYHVYMGEAAGQALTLPFAYVSVPGATSIQIAGLTAKSTRWFVVRAVDSAGMEDTNTIEKSGSTLDLTPPEFAGVESLAASGDTLSVSFSPASDNVDAPSAIKYRIYLAATPGGEDFSTPEQETAPGVAGAILTSVTASPAYYVVVRAVDASGNEDQNTVERSIDFGDTVAPGFGGAVSATGLTNAVKLSFTAATDNVSSASTIVYLAYQASAAGQEDYTQPVATSAPGVTTITVGGLMASTTYYFVVRARDQAGNIDKNTMEVSATTLAGNDTTPPSFTGLTSATSSGPSSVALSWSTASDLVSPSGEIVYEIFQADAAGAENFTAPTYTTAPGATSFSVTGLTASKPYYFVVRARDQAGNRETNSVEKSATTDTDNTPPSFAGAMSATPISSTRISLSWAPASDGTTPEAGITYLGYMATSFGGQSYATPTVTSMPGVTSMQVSGLSPSTAYYFVVRAQDGAGNIDTNTAQVMATTLADTVRPTFAGATSATASGTSITIKWAAGSDDITPSNGLVYDIYRATSSGGQSFATPTYTSAAGATSFTASGLGILSTYYFVVRARDAAGNRDQNTVEVSASTGL